MNYVCRVPWGSLWLCILSHLLFSLIFSGGACKEEVTANPLKKSVWCKTIFSCCPILFVAFVCLLSNWSAAGQDWATVGGDAPAVLTAAGRAQDPAESGTPSSAPCSCKAAPFLPLPPPPPPPCPLFKFFKAGGPQEGRQALCKCSLSLNYFLT